MKTSSTLGKLWCIIGQRVPALAVLPQSWVIVQTELILWTTGKQRLQKREKIFSFWKVA